MTKKYQPKDFLEKTSRENKKHKMPKKRRTNEGTDHQSERHRKINFKKYLESIEEEFIEDEDDSESLDEDETS